MRAVVIEAGSVVVKQCPEPSPGSGELLVRIQAAGLNNADLLQTAGHYPPPPGWPIDIPGLELTGIVEVVGTGASRFAVGDRVMAVVGGGAQAELTTIHERIAMAVPETLPTIQAGGFPEAFTVAHDALFTQCGLRPGERLLVNGAAGGVGVAGVQLGVLAGATVVASVRAEHLRGHLEAFGAIALDPAEVAREGPYDVILELVGGPNLQADLASLRLGGRLVIIGIGAGARTEIDLRQILAKRARISGSTLRARPLEGRAAAIRLVESQVLPLVAAGRIHVPIEQSFPMNEAQAAYERFAAGSKFGKIVLDIGA